ncbi:MAG: HAD hydrolase-like protein, partial [bacterium]|nr:HAD hydrolase-like protein [bacterium]
MSRRRSLTDSVRGFIFDVDGVIADTAVHHTAAWRRLATEEGLPFDEALSDRLRGVSRSESLRTLLGDIEVSPARFEELADRKNSYYGECLNNLAEADVLPGVRSL